MLEWTHLDYWKCVMGAYEQTSVEQGRALKLLYTAIAGYVAYRILPWIYEHDGIPGVSSPAYEQWEKTIRFDMVDRGFVYEGYYTDEPQGSMPECCKGKMRVWKH